MASPRIAKYSLSDLKNTTDDALPNYLNSLNFRQKHHFTDVRLALGYAAVCIAGVLFFADYKLGWDATKVYTLWAVIAYFILNTALTIWIWKFERGVVYAGERGGRKIVIASSVKKPVPTYKIVVQEEGQNPFEISSSFTRWFNEDGLLVSKPFQQWLATEVAAIGEADPKNKCIGTIGSSNSPRQIAEAVVIQPTETKIGTTPGSGTPTSRSKRNKQ